MNIKALHASTMLTIILIAILTIASELDSGFKGVLVGIAGHHWVAKGIISLVVFIVFSLVFSYVFKKDGEGLGKLTFVITILAGLAIFLFYVWHFLVG